MIYLYSAFSFSQRRVSVFCELFEMNRMENISVDADQSDQLLKLLDSVVIKLEGGTDLDLQVLDQAPEEDVKSQPIEEEKKPFILGEEYVHFFDYLLLYFLSPPPYSVTKQFFILISQKTLSFTCIMFERDCKLWKSQKSY